MRQKKKSVFRRLILMAVMAAMLIGYSIPAMATDTSSSAAAEVVSKAKNGVVWIQLVYVDNKNAEYVLQGGSGFLIGPSTGTTTVITNYHVVTLTSEDAAVYGEVYGVDFTDTRNVTLKIRVVIQADVTIDAEYIQGSEQGDFAILTMSQSINNRTPLTLADSDKLVDTQTVYALGFPGATSDEANAHSHASSDVTATQGIVGKIQTSNEYTFIAHDASLGYGNSGGPLVDANGNVVGINTMYNGDAASNYYYSIAINDVREILDAIGITYTSADGTSTPVTEAATEAVTESAVTEASVTPETAADISATDGDEIEVIEPESAETEKGGFDTKLIIIIVAAVVIVVVIIIIVVATTTSKNRKKKSNKNIPPHSGGAGGMPPMGGQPPVQQHQQPPRGGQPTPPSYMGGSMPTDTGAGETSVLGSGAGETSVLGGNMQPRATLVRRKNGETKTLTKSLYVIGKERAKVDFCIPDNNSISRRHAEITCKGGIYYIKDNNSTNFTFVNGNKISPNQEVKLNSGDKIKLADEEFEFRI